MLGLSPYLCDDILEVALPPGVGGVGHHGDDGVVKLLVLVVEEYKLRPQVSLLSCTQDLSFQADEKGIEYQNGDSLYPHKCIAMRRVIGI